MANEKLFAGTTEQTVGVTVSGGVVAQATIAVMTNIASPNPSSRRNQRRRGSKRE